MAPKSVQWYKPQSIHICDAGNTLQLICFGQRFGQQRCHEAQSQLFICDKGSTTPLNHVEPLVGMCALCHIPSLRHLKVQNEAHSVRSCDSFLCRPFCLFESPLCVTNSVSKLLPEVFRRAVCAKKGEQVVHQLLVPPPAVVVVHHLQPVLGHFLKKVRHASVSGGYANNLFRKARAAGAAADASAGGGSTAVQLGFSGSAAPLPSSTGLNQGKPLCELPDPKEHAGVDGQVAAAAAVWWVRVPSRCCRWSYSRMLFV